MWVTNARSAALSIVPGRGKWVEIKIYADPLYQHFLLTSEKRFWRWVQTGEMPRPFGVEPPQPRIEGQDCRHEQIQLRDGMRHRSTRPAQLERDDFTLMRILH
jgi:hypothetical protein